MFLTLFYLLVCLSLEEVSVIMDILYVTALIDIAIIAMVTITNLYETKKKR